jgi:hypothetical protein
MRMSMLAHGRLGLGTASDVKSTKLIAGYAGMSEWHGIRVGSIGQFMRRLVAHRIKRIVRSSM